jgi:hypothetical protein
MMVRTLATLDDLENFISDNWREYCAADAKRLAIYKMRIPFREWEARFSMRGLELGVFEVSSGDGRLHYQRLGGNVTTFFSCRGPGRCREVVTQFAALAELIEEYNWPEGNIMAEPMGRGKANQYAFDGLVFDGTRPEPKQLGQSCPAVRIAIEAKVRSGDVKKLIEQINQCIERGPHEKDAHPQSQSWVNSHRKFQAILEWKPAYFLVVAPEERRVYSVRWDNETSFSLEVVKDIPRWSPC